MKAILDEMLAALSRGERVVLSSILASSGSVPRGAGAKMAVFEDDRVLGTIGGGAVERLSIQRAQDALKNGGSNELKSYNLHPSEVASTGMICGGAVTVYFQFFAPEQTADVAVLKRWREMLDKDVDLWLLLSLDGDRRTRRTIFLPRPCGRTAFLSSRCATRAACISSAAAMWAARSCRCWRRWASA